MSKQKKNADKEFKIASWAIDNPSVIFVMIAILLWVGFQAYQSMPREDYPEIVETKVYVSTPYPGNTAEDIERLITDPLEDRLKNVSNVVETTSTSQEDYSIITVEFDEDITVEQAKQKVKDEVDSEKASEDWPTFNGAKVEPNIFDLNLAESFPIMNVNFTGDYPVEKLKEYAEYLEDEIENLPQIKEVDIRGAQKKEVEVAVDVYKMMAAKVSFQDVISAIGNGNMTMSAGNIKTSEQRRTIRVLGEIENPKELQNFVVKSENGAVYLKDIATVTFDEEEKTTFAREFGESVVMLDIKKRSGTNTIEATQQIRELVKKAQSEYYPADLNISIANDSSDRTLNQVDDLVNSIIFGIILVVTVLMFFLGFRNALFVGFAIPMSMFISFFVLNTLGVVIDSLSFTLNTMVLFGMIMGLGMLVDNGIVVVENVYRLMSEGMSRTEAAKKGIGEIAYPIIISTVTTVAAFVPLGLWPGLFGQFMIYFPVTLSVVLGSSLFVALFMNSMLVSQYMEIGDKEISKKGLIRTTAILGGLGLLILFVGGAVRGLGTVMIFTALMFWAYKYAIKGAANRFQNKVMPRFENWYERRIRHALRGGNVYWYFGVTVLLLVVTFVLFGMSIGAGRTKIEFFPENSPNEVYVYIEYPEGTSIEKTNKITKAIEERVYAVIARDKYKKNADYNYLVESAVSQVGEGAGNPQTDGGSASEMPHRGKVTVSMREFKYRNGLDTEELRGAIQADLTGIYPGVSISVEKLAEGPPAGYPVNIELQGKDYDELINTAENIRNYLNSKNISFIEELKINVNKSKPSMQVVVDREKAGELGVAVGQVGNQLRRSLFGEKAGVFKQDGEDYDINVRFNNDLRFDQNALFNQNIIFRDQASGQIKEIPVSAVASRRNSSGFSSIKHRNGNRVVTVYSGLTAGGNPAQVVDNVRKEMENFKGIPESVKVDYTGEIEEQNKQMAFLVGAFFGGLALIMLILIFQFGSISKPLIIMIAIFLSFIGVFGGLMITGWSFVIMMTMMGIISLAGIVVNNGVVLLDYTQILIDRKKLELNMDDKDLLTMPEVTKVITQSGKARLRPVILTAITTVLGLIPLAIGLNIDFFSLFTEFDPKIYFGGDNVVFWGPLAWTVIFGLIVATFLTLIIVPVLFNITYRIKTRVRSWRKSDTKDKKETLIENPEYDLLPKTGTAD
ncbi:efflux RND transporter permease subunit [Aggregatimonas sangjinii]|uniref:Efflux RND transporter permease subunit n=1 Tax=Aggregatimonas sangjinii TaxID=2583587 RepID=A0A5B7SWG3_9FLAO|nr:efflux RND transporter permease subunit [Aggregatimonas sangjinii]QCX01669.1 efflux RND transporter permease subunit [Aggregatimonas sangjinii]